MDRRSLKGNSSKGRSGWNGRGEGSFRPRFLYISRLKTESLTGLLLCQGHTSYRKHIFYRPQVIITDLKGRTDLLVTNTNTNVS